MKGHEKTVLPGDPAVFIEDTGDGELSLELGLAGEAEGKEFLLCEPQTKTATMEIFPDGEDTQKIELGKTSYWSFR